MIYKLSSGRRYLNGELVSWRAIQVLAYWSIAFAFCFRSEGIPLQHPELPLHE